ncbi:MAG: alpha/beta hydrolase [Pseudomonadota bacterium]
MSLPGFETRMIDVGNGIELFVATGGEGAPLLLLHGYPQTHMCWAKVAPMMVDAGYSVVIPDLTGYGQSSKPETDAHHSPYSKREIARNMADLMTALGHERFLLAGHDRGGRVAHALSVNEPDRVRKLAVLDIAPTLAMYEGTDQAFATAYYHWFFLIQPAPLPETMIGADPDFFLKTKIGSWAKTDNPFTEEALTSYLTAFRNPATIHASCEDYRAAATIDLDHSREDLANGRRIKCPVHSLWGARAFAAKSYDLITTWQDVADASVTGKGLDCGHFVPEECPEETAAELVTFFAE